MAKLPIYTSDIVTMTEIVRALNSTYREFSQGKDFDYAAAEKLANRILRRVRKARRAYVARIERVKGNVTVDDLTLAREATAERLQRTLKWTQRLADLEEAAGGRVGQDLAFLRKSVHAALHTLLESWTDARPI